MAFTRKNVWELGDNWADTILWYARGVAAMKAKALAEPTSWRFYGAIHGFNQDTWQQLGYFSAADPMPSDALVSTFWEQCQHGSWYFLPWHRGYLLAFEANIRAEVIKAGGPADWALPYWNYFKLNESALPPAFASADWPDGQGSNPLFVTQRYGPFNNGTVSVPLSGVNLKAMRDPDFVGVSSGGSVGFGGPDTGFLHGGGNHGGIEAQPHDMVHVYVGGGTQQDPGLMIDPDTAGLDPIFWLHHANIDRLWQVWHLDPTTNGDPTDANWINGPASVGDRIFAMPMPDGTTWNYTPGQMRDLQTLEYNYDDVSPAVAAAPLHKRLQRLGLVAADAVEGIAPMETGKNVELVGANQEQVRLQGSEASTSVHLDKGVRQKVATSLSLVAENPAPDRVFLNIENVRGASDATAFDVYVGLPKGANPKDYPDNLAGSVGLFGVRKASLPDGEHGGQGLTFVLEITDIVDKLHLDNALDVDTLDVRLVPLTPVPAEAKVSIGRISIFRQGN